MTTATAMGSARVCVVTPFYNSAAYLDQCIRSVLEQSFGDFDYLLCDNASDDGSSEIAQFHATRDARVRYFRFEQHLPQVENYNRAISAMGAHVAYCKIVQADDWLFPECLSRMVQLADAHPDVGLVASYFLRGTRVSGAGPEPGTLEYDGRMVIREKLRKGLFGLGSPTAVMYRADLVRAREPFFPTARMHEDTDVVYELLAVSNLGFVPQILCVQRVGNPSIRTRTDQFDQAQLDRLIQVETYARRFLAQDEAASLVNEARRAYFRCLGRHAIRFRRRDFWDYHFRGLATLGWRPPIARVALAAVAAAAGMLLNPIGLLAEIGRNFRHR